MTMMQVIPWSEIRPPTPDLLILYINKLGYHMTHWVGQPGLVYAWHRTQQEECHWIVSGELEISYQNGYSYTLKAGERDVIPTETWYMMRVIGEVPVDYLLGVKPNIVEKPKRKRGRPKKYE